MASKGVNKVILIGHLGQDPEIRYMPNGGAVCNIQLATSDSWRDKQTGEQKEITEWHRVVIFGKLAEIAGDYLRKGAQIYIEGQLRTRKWQGQDGTDRYTTEIVVNVGGTMQMLGSRQQQDNKAPARGTGAAQQQSQQSHAPQPASNPAPSKPKGKGAKAKKHGELPDPPMDNTPPMDAGSYPIDWDNEPPF